MSGMLLETNTMTQSSQLVAVKNWKKPKKKPKKVEKKPFFSEKFQKIEVKFDRKP